MGGGIIQINVQQMRGVKEALRLIADDADLQIKIALGKTAKDVKIAAARQLKKVMNVRVNGLKRAVRIKRPKSQDELSMTIQLAYGFPIPLKYFGAKQLKRGVTYKIDPKFKRKDLLRDAFIVERYGGNVFKRKGKERGPLIKMHGPAPGDYYEKGGVTEVAVKTANEELPKQINERLRFLIVKAQGKLRGKL
jgi:hypothetical protein